MTDHAAPTLVGLPAMIMSLFRIILSGHDSVFYHSVAALPRYALWSLRLIRKIALVSQAPQSRDMVRRGVETDNGLAVIAAKPGDPVVVHSSLYLRYP